MAKEQKIQIILNHRTDFIPVVIYQSGKTQYVFNVPEGS